MHYSNVVVTTVAFLAGSAFAAPAAEPEPQYQYAGYQGCTVKKYIPDGKPENLWETDPKQGWELYGGASCDTIKGGQCSLTHQDGKSVTKEFSLSFGGGGDFGVKQALSLGLDFGFSIAVTDEKSDAYQVDCPEADADNNCVCGLQVRTWKVRSHGKTQNSDSSGRSCGTGKYDVTTAMLQNGVLRTEWRACRAQGSTCSAMKDKPAC